MPTPLRTLAAAVARSDDLFPNAWRGLADRNSELSEQWGTWRCRVWQEDARIAARVEGAGTLQAVHGETEPPRACPRLPSASLFPYIVPVHFKSGYGNAAYMDRPWLRITLAARGPAPLLGSRAPAVPQNGTTFLPHISDPRSTQSD